MANYGYELGKEVLLIIAEHCDLKTVSTIMQTCKVSRLSLDLHKYLIQALVSIYVLCTVSRNTGTLSLRTYFSLPGVFHIVKTLQGNVFQESQEWLMRTC